MTMTFFIYKMLSLACQIEATFENFGRFDVEMKCLFPLGIRILCILGFMC